MKRTLLLFALLTSCNLLFAQKNDWILVSTSSDSIKFYYKPNTKNTAWVKSIKENNKNKEYNITLYQFDCEERKIGAVRDISYKNGKVLADVALKSYEVEMNYVVPETIGESLLKYFCIK